MINLPCSVDNPRNALQILVEVNTYKLAPFRVFDKISELISYTDAPKKLSNSCVLVYFNLDHWKITKNGISTDIVNTVVHTIYILPPDMINDRLDKLDEYNNNNDKSLLQNEHDIYRPI